MQDTLLNLIPGACSPEVHLSQYDKGRVVPFKLADGKSAYDVPAGSAIVVKATKPSGLGFIVPVSFDGDTAIMTITETMSNEYGRFPAELSITNGDTLIGTANFVMNVEKSPHPEGTVDGDAETLLPELRLLVNEIRESNAKVESMTASATSLPSGSEPTAEYDPDTNNLAFGIPVSEVTAEDLYKAFIVKSASGSIASFSDGGDDLPMKSLKVNIVPKQSGSGDPSPSNVRPISGWDEVDVTRCGKNLMPLTLYDGFGYNLAVGTSVTPTLSSRTLTDNGDGTFDIAFTSTWQNATIMQSLPLDGSLRFATVVTSTGNLGISLYLLDDSYKVLLTVIGNSNPTNFVSNINLADYPSARYIAVAFTNRNTANVTLTITNPQLTIGTSAQDYEPYEGETITTNLPQTVYGGVLDVVSGKLVIDKALVDLGSLTWNYFANNVLFIAPMPNDCVPNSALGGVGVCSTYKRYTGATNFWTAMGNNEFCYARSGYSSAKQVYIKDSRYTTASDFKTAMNGVQLVYELATPTEIQLTPTEVKTLLGSNNIWADAGTVEVEYRADTTLAYNELVAMILENIGG